MSEATPESRLNNVEERLTQLSKDFIESHDTLQDGVLKLRQNLNGIEAMLEGLEKSPPDRAELYAALAKAQGEIQAAEANKEAEIRKKDDYSVILYTFKYADLAACLEVIRKPLSDNGLALIQIPSLGENNEVHMRTVLGHESGQTISCEMTMSPEKGGPQAIGTCMAYLRRYSLCALIGVAQFDDDAASATKGPGEYDRLTPRDIDEILVHADDLFGDDADAVLDDMLKAVFPDKHHLADIPANQLKPVLRRLTNAKKKRDKKAADEARSPVAEPKKPKSKDTTEGKTEPGADG